MSSLIKEDDDGDRDSLLRAMKLPAEGRRSGGRDQGDAGGRREAGAGWRWDIRRDSRRAHDLLQVRDGPVPRT